MTTQSAPPKIENEPNLMIALGWAAIAGCAIFIVTITIADFVVPDHNLFADTISDLGAGKFEFIVDTGIYAYSSSMICIALLLAHVHLGGAKWSFAIIGFAAIGLIVFLIGARNEYGDGDDEGVVIHIYLVYALGALMAVVPWLCAEGAGRVGAFYRRGLMGLCALWTVSAPVFFILPDSVDGIYERYLGLVSMAVVILLARLYISRGWAMKAEQNGR